MFVTIQDFDKYPYQIPQIKEVENSFNDFIERMEEDKLMELLGLLLNDAFIAGLGAPIIEDRWLKLRDGDTYVYKSHSYKWKGMNELFKPYIYSIWLREDVDKLSSTGTNISEVENGMIVNGNRRIVNAFNVFSNLAGEYCRQRTSLYGYLYNSGEVFNDIIQPEYSDIRHYMVRNFKRPGRMNTFNL